MDLDVRKAKWPLSKLGFLVETSTSHSFEVSGAENLHNTPAELSGDFHVLLRRSVLPVHVA